MKKFTIVTLSAAAALLASFLGGCTSGAPTPEADSTSVAPVISSDVGDVLPVTPSIDIEDELNKLGYKKALTEEYTSEDQPKILAIWKSSSTAYELSVTGPKGVKPQFVSSISTKHEDGTDWSAFWCSFDNLYSPDSFEATKKAFSNESSRSLQHVTDQTFDVMAPAQPNAPLCYVDFKMN